MKKVIMSVLMLCLTLSGALCYARGSARTENEKGKDGIPIEVIENASHSSPEKGSCILASIDGHYLTVAFSENIGQVEVEITTDTGTTVDCVNTSTPTGFQCYIPDAGDYVVTFTLSNGDEYYGEFTITD